MHCSPISSARYAIPSVATINPSIVCLARVKIALSGSLSGRRQRKFESSGISLDFLQVWRELGEARAFLCDKVRMLSSGSEKFAALMIEFPSGA